VRFLNILKSTATENGNIPHWGIKEVSSLLLTLSIFLAKFHQRNKPNKPKQPK